MHTALLSSDSKSELDLIVELAKKLNLQAKIISDDDFEELGFYKANESALKEWNTPEEDEAWKNL